eukprot:TRINITY_DN29565_c0_g1_i2.p1 TRINITY_DN29565_c0_g1~~TRINITY_DN29565_c0_g1_i2.p1  ORF type:complete len:676 (+),score=119.26 TRINITY_DN29565_c0_g1_i2:156-2183(+)
MAQQISDGVVHTAILLGSPPGSEAEAWHWRIVLYGITAVSALGVEMGYTKLVPKLPQLYAALIRAAVWDCVIIGVLAAQVFDLSGLPLLSSSDSTHFLPVAVILYHTIVLVVCVGYDTVTRRGFGYARTWHHSLVTRRVLLEMVGGSSGSGLALGRACFVVSAFAMWLVPHTISWFTRGPLEFSGLVTVLFIAYCAAGLAALEPRQTLPGQLVQWVFTGWGSREALLEGPVKILSATFILPFALSVVAAQIWLRTMAFLVWLIASCPCCRLQRANNVYDAFEREMCIPLLQTSYLAFACTLTAFVLGASKLPPAQCTTVIFVAAYYFAMLILWASPAVLRAKINSEERADTDQLLGESNEGQLLPANHDSATDGDVELEDLRATCEELRALLARERHRYNLEVAQLQSKLKDQEICTRTVKREKDAAVDNICKMKEEMKAMELRNAELYARLKVCRKVPELPLWSIRRPTEEVDGKPQEQQHPCEPTETESSGCESQLSEASGASPKAPKAAEGVAEATSSSPPPAAEAVASGSVELAPDKLLQEVHLAPAEVAGHDRLDCIDLVPSPGSQASDGLVVDGQESFGQGEQPEVSPEPAAAPLPPSDEAPAAEQADVASHPNATGAAADVDNDCVEAVSCMEEEDEIPERDDIVKERAANTPTEGLQHIDDGAAAPE